MNLITKFKELKIFLFLFLLLFLFYVAILPKSGHGWDSFLWKEWCIYTFNEGLSQIYSSGTDYLPLYHYILWIFGQIQGSVVSIQNNIFFLKSITLIFDFICGFVMILFLNEKFKDKSKVFLLSLFYFFNIGIFYNTIMWGQVDGIVTCFIFLSFYYAYKKNILPSLAFYIIAINFKLQAIIFLPLVGLILLPTIIQSLSIKKFLLWIIIPSIIQLLILLPFIISGTTSKIWDVVINSFGKFPVVSMNAFNIWYFFLDGNLMGIKDNETLFGFTYNKIGLILFFVISFLSLFPLIKSVLKSIKSKTLLQFPTEKLLIIGALIPLLFFYLNTQMHERYSHPAFIFIMTFCILKNKPFLGVLSSLAYLLNLESVLHFFQIHNYGTVIFSPIFISILYLLTIILLFFELYEISIFKKRYLVNFQKIK
jgi:Gpi18-like mannosyltransferase